MSEDFDKSQEETGLPLLKEGNFASFAPVNNQVFVRLTRAFATARKAVSREHTYNSLWKLQKNCLYHF